MAYTNETLKGFVAGSGKAPGIWKYTSADLYTDITTSGYFDKDIAPVMNIGDFIFITSGVGTGNSLGRIGIVASNTNLVVDVSDSSTFAGDVRATDPAGYQADNFGGNIGAGSSIRMFTYRNNTDTVATIGTAGYFDEIADALEVGDMIFVIGNDDAIVLSITSINGGVVTTQDSGLV
jgi:hypothetical protein